MPRIDRLAKLVRAVAAEDWKAAKASAAELAHAEEEKGHHSAAQLLRGALNPNARTNAVHENGTWIGDSGLLSAALTRLPGTTELKDVALRAVQRRELTSLVEEWRYRHVLASRGVDRRRKLLFYGPPGCGKSLTAAALGAELSLPAFVVRVDAVVGAFLGQTALRIRELFAFAERTACVLLLDEIDALAKRRGSLRDVGELDRIVISLMQELEHASPQGLVIATSNIPEHLDEAVFRRFDQVVEFPRPSHKEIARFAAAHARAREIVPPSSLKRLLVGTRSYAEAARRIAAEERSIVLREVTR
jgi:SpoVK/Ycf46/Vps4 family AAA+-type ATPase